MNTNSVKLEMKKLKEEPDVKVEKSKLVKCKAEFCGAVYSHIAKKDDEKKVLLCCCLIGLWHTGMFVLVVRC